MNFKSLSKFFVLSFVVVPSIVLADSKLLSDFLIKSKTLKADFTQTISNGSKIAQQSKGALEISRPNKFRWNYTTEEQLIVSDAKDIYIYDKPLEQVTIKSLGSSIDKSPAALLAGSNDLQSNYKINDTKSTANNLSWVLITPKKDSDNNGFKMVQMGFDKKGLISIMKFADSFGSTTTLKFDNVIVGDKLSDKDFKFKIPKGVDVAR